MANPLGDPVRLEREGKTIELRFAPPDLLTLDDIARDNEKWESLKSSTPEERAKSGFLRELNDFVAKYAATLCTTHVIGVIENGVKRPENADLYISRTAGHRSDFSAAEQMQIFMTIMKDLDSVAKGLEEWSAKADTFRQASLGRRDRHPGLADRPPSE